MISDRRRIRYRKATVELHYVDPGDDSSYFEIIVHGEDEMDLTIVVDELECLILDGEVEV